MSTVAGHKRRRSRAERREQQRANLFQTLERLLATAAFPEITIPQILEEAKISRATFYLYFEDKAALLLATAETIFVAADEVMGAWWDGPTDRPREELDASLRGVFDLYREHQHVLRALVDAAGYEPAVRAQLTHMHERYITDLARHIRSGQASGHIRRSAPPRPTASWVIWMIERGLYQVVADAPARTLKEQSNALAGLIWHGLYDARGDAPPT